MSIRIAHIGDVHYRSLSRHNEYRQVFEEFCRKTKELEVDIIYVGGDIYHTKTQGISPEVIDEMSWFFNSLAEVAPTHIILGNHDGNLVNSDRQDAITPIVSALNNPNVHLYKKSGTYPTGISGFNWCVFSCFDEDGWDDVKPTAGDINIALYHGCVVGSTTDQNWELDGEISLDYFDDYEFVMLGDIHKFQFLNEKKTAAYSGSTVQQNYGEDPNKGFLVWDIRTKDDFDVKFYRLSNPHPFVTINWEGNVSGTLLEAKKHKPGCRFRVRTTETIPQIEIKQFHNELKHLLQPKEVVWKFDQDPDKNNIIDDRRDLVKEDLRDPKIQTQILKDYVFDGKFNDDEWEDIEKLVSRYITLAIQNEDITRHAKWSIKALEFDNTFSYGKNNKIDFTKLSGITGILGRNRAGKSSIVGTMVYNLFNGTDRGSIKNLHVINSRKGHCKSKMTLGIGGKDHLIERQSVRYEDKKGKQSAVTTLNFQQVDPDGNVIQDLNGEQRTQTEKTVRNMLGTADDFLLTSLATQGNMNAFINQGSSHRKYVLSKFLDLDIFEKMTNFVKIDSTEIKGRLSAYPERDWNAAIVSLRGKKKEHEQEMIILEKEISGIREEAQKVKSELAGFSDADLVSETEISEQKNEVNNLEEKYSEIQVRLQACSNRIQATKDSIVKIEDVKKKFPINDLRSRYVIYQDLDRQLESLEHQRDAAKQILKTQEKSVKLLDEVPCGDSFPTCKFIKNSHKNKHLLTNQKEIVSNFSRDLSAMKRSFKKLESEDLQEKIQKYELLITRLSKYNVDLSKRESEREVLDRDFRDVSDTLEKAARLLSDMQLRTATSSVSDVTRQLNEKFKGMKSEIQQKDARRISLAELKGNIDNQVEKLQTERDEYTELKKIWKIYDFLMKAWSKKGVPTQIIRLQLPSINSEIEKILSGVVDFTVKLETDPDSNSAEIYLDYGDSRRIIELASGMEKMISSLAIRVALLNVSSLPKTDMLIIDEGFGSLDEAQVAACNSMLVSLKKWFRNILVITHVDSVKDIVDNTLEIELKGMDSFVSYE